MRNQSRINKTVGVLHGPYLSRISFGEKIPHVILYSYNIKNDDRIKQHYRFTDFNNISVTMNTKTIDYNSAFQEYVRRYEGVLEKKRVMTEKKMKFDVLEIVCYL